MKSSSLFFLEETTPIITTIAMYKRKNMIDSVIKSYLPFRASRVPPSGFQKAV